MRVKVHDGTGEHFIGYGEYVGEVDVYVVVMPDGSLRSLGNAEKMPPDDMIPEGSIVKKIRKNPKIQMDDGSVRYGCQVWWEPLAEVVEVTDESTYDPWAVSDN